MERIQERHAGENFSLEPKFRIPGWPGKRLSVSRSSDIVEMLRGHGSARYGPHIVGMDTPWIGAVMP